MGCKAGDEVIAHRHCIFCFYLVGPSLAVYILPVLLFFIQVLPFCGFLLLPFCGFLLPGVLQSLAGISFLDSENENFCPFPDILNHEYVLRTMDTYILKND
jgi:hypothetical protein